jgi:CRISPR/Cas system CMR-associated protein Cmr5 small subunit
MTTLVLIISAISFLFAVLAIWASLYTADSVKGKIECLREHCDERMSALAVSMSEHIADTGAEDAELKESMRQAIEAERRYTEGVANILNFSSSVAGKKGE